LSSTRCPYTTLFRSTTARPAGVGVVARLAPQLPGATEHLVHRVEHGLGRGGEHIGVDSVLEPQHDRVALDLAYRRLPRHGRGPLDRKSTRLNSSHVK